MKVNATLSDRQCRHAENRMRSASMNGGIVDDGKVLLTPDKCASASMEFFVAWSYNQGGKFNEIITLDEFTREEIRAILVSI